MTHRWKQTIKIDLDLAQELITSQFNLPVKAITLLDEGWDNLVYLVNDELIFRFPRREFGLSCMENEIALLPYIAQHVNFPLSSPQWIGQPSDSYPFPFGGYPLLPGKPLCDVATSLIDDKNFAKILAGWLKELHAIPVRQSDTDFLKGDQGWRLNLAFRVKRCHENLEQYGQFFIEAGFDVNQLLKVVDKIGHFNIAENKHTYAHGDLYHRHILVDPASHMPTGIIDWGDIHIGHPGVDLAVGMIFTPSAFKEFLGAYGDIDNETIAILQLQAFAHAMSFLPYAYEQNKEPLKRWSIFQLGRAIKEILSK